MKKILTVLSLSLVFVLSCIAPLSASASVFDRESFPTRNDGYTYQWYIMYTYEDNKSVRHTALIEFLNDNNIPPVLIYDEVYTRLFVKNSSGGRYHYYSLSTTEPYVWEFKSTSTTTGETVTNDANAYFSMRYSDIDIYDSSGNLFFHQRPLFHLQQGAEKVKVILSTSLLQTTAGTLRIVVPFGVGLLTLVIGLKVFGIISKRFLT